VADAPVPTATPASLAFVDELRGLRWPARRRVPAGLPGAHRSRQRGTTGEFTEYRPYRQGDEPRRIDWRLLARSDRAFVRLADDHALLPTVLVVDATASMAFPEDTRAKWRLARDVALGCAAVSLRMADPVGLVTCAATGARRLAPRSPRT